MGAQHVQTQTWQIAPSAHTYNDVTIIQIIYLPVYMNMYSCIIKQVLWNTLLALRALISDTAK